MKKNVLKYGLIAGLIVSMFMVGSIAFCYTTEKFEGSIIVGYASMFIAFSMVFVGVKSYRDKELNGLISFGNAFKIGLLISLVASTIYVIVWMVDYYFFVPDFMEKFTAVSIEKLNSSGLTAQEIADQTEEMNTMKELYKSPFMVIAFTYLEILPIGILVSLISAFILKKKA